MSLLSQLQKHGILSPLSVHFARFIARQEGLAEESLCVQSAAFLSERNQQGDVCLDLQQWAGRRSFGELAAPFPSLEQWQQTLRASACVGQPGDPVPLILEGQRLYLQRFWQYECAVFEAIRTRLANVDDLDTALLGAGLARLFPETASSKQQVDWQKVASALALSRRFAVISGGPGTGKTTTAVKVLALLLEQDPTLRISLAAPTGKAAARMVESIRAAREPLPLSPQIAALLPDQASTLHRLLGYQNAAGVRGFRHHAKNLLQVDCLLIDEASMIDLPLMWALLEACAADTRLILLGDRDQLASVEAGNVLGDITGHGQELHYSPAMAHWLEELCGLPADCLARAPATPPVADALALLRTSYRFHADSGIGALARAVNAGDAAVALSTLSQGVREGELALQDLLWLQPTANAWQPLNPAVLQWARERYGAYLVCTDVQQALSAFATSRILCAAHEGPVGERELNARVAERLRQAGLLEAGEQVHGTPVMVTVNDYEMELFNGDIGLLWRDAAGVLEACFPASEGGVRRIPAGSLPEHVTAWAMTVHKSQGSEFNEVLLVLPADAESRLLLRELVYTGITRARQRLLLHSSAAALEKACVSCVQRSSGLAARLGWDVVSGD